jgi:hypothetical protein
MDCNEFERWLDEGMPADDPSRDAAERHAASCGRCAETAGAARTLEALLAAAPASAPSGFAGRVMERVRLGMRTGRPAVRIPAAPAMPWWIRAMSDPAAAVTFTLGILGLVIAGRPHALAGALSPLLRAASVLLVSSLEGPAAGLASLPVQAGIALGVLPIVVLASFPLYRWSDALFRRKAHRMTPRLR